MTRPKGASNAKRRALRVFKCRECGEPVTFLFTKNGRRIPCDLDNVTLADEQFIVDQHIAHATTCGVDESVCRGLYE